VTALARRTGEAPEVVAGRGDVRPTGRGRARPGVITIGWAAPAGGNALRATITSGSDEDGRRPVHVATPVPLMRP
jgi:hypothetical protein